MGVGASGLTRGTARSARHVRLLARAIIFGLIVGAVVAQVPRGLGSESVEVVAGQDPVIAAERVFTEQVRMGRTCHKDAVLTDAVIFQYTVPDGAMPDVRALTFDDALDAAAAGDGWVLWYCV